MVEREKERERKREREREREIMKDVETVPIRAIQRKEAKFVT